MKLTFIIAVLTVAAAVPSVGFVARYSRMPWWKSEVGKAVMVQAVSLMMLIGMGVLRVFFGTEYRWREGLLLFVYTALVVGLWWMFIALLRVRRLPPPDRLPRHLNEATTRREDDDDRDR